MINFDVIAFGNYIKIMRKHNNLSLRDLQEHIGITAATLSRIERGEMPDLITFATLCKWYGIRMEAFIS